MRLFLLNVRRLTSRVVTGSQINFITGVNGSGKSALLVAINVALAGKMSFTGRGASVRTLVREGQNEARVFIRLRNVGSDAFQHDVPCAACRPRFCLTSSCSSTATPLR